VKVFLIGKTQVDLFPFQGDSTHHMPGKASGSEFEKRVHQTAVYSKGQSGQELIEFAGRLCYESFDLPNEKTKTNPGYVRNIVSLGHESVLEHVSVTFYVEGVSRNLTHELIRHRHLSFSELSQRYVDMAEANWVTPPAFLEAQPDLPEIAPLSPTHARDYKANVQILEEDHGITGKAARQAARYTLPSGMETKIVVSGNLRAWRDVLKKRLSKHADAEMQLFAKQIRAILGEEYPDVFADIEFDGE